MPIIVPDQAPAAKPESLRPHQARQVAESFGSDAARYDRTRPRYPDALMDRIVATSSGLSVLDVGCGTGIAARQLQAAGCQVLGVDVDARMAELARQFGLDVEVAKFEDWDPASRAFDTVIAAQAWHWVDPVAGAVKAAQALRPGGQLTMFWNAMQPPADLAEAFSAVYRRVLPADSPLSRIGAAGLGSYQSMCAAAAGGMRQAGSFGDPEEWRCDWARTYARDEWLEQVPTFGGHSQLPPAALDELLTGIGVAIDAAGGSFTMTYTAMAVTAIRTGA